MKRLAIFFVLVIAVASVTFFYILRNSEKSTTPQPAHEIPIFASVGPRLVSNQSAYPLYIYGSHLPNDARLVIGSKPEIRIPTQRINDSLHFATLDPRDIAISNQIHRQRFSVRLEHEDGAKIGGKSHLDVVNDTDYPVPYDFAVDREGSRAWVISPTTDEIYVIGSDGVISVLETGDRPRAIARWVHDDDEFFVVAHEYVDELWVFKAAEPNAAPRKIPAAPVSQSLAIRGDTAAVTSRLDDSVSVIGLVDGKTTGAYSVGIDPRAITFVGPGSVAVGHIGSADLVVRELSSEPPETILPGPGAKILGGRTSKYTEFIMGGKLLRHLEFDGKNEVLYASSIGPNIGPNPDEMEVSMNGGITVYERDETWKFSHHASMHRGTPEEILYVPESDLLYAADIAMGRLMVFDGPSLRETETAAKALRAALEIMPPDDTPILRDRSDFGVEGRPGLEMLSGTRALARGSDPDRIFALNRFTGTISVVDATNARDNALDLVETWGPIDLGAQKQRRAGEAVYFTDMGNSRMSCDTCHYEGHNEGLLYTKGQPTHIYRVPTVRSISETAPYFTPAAFPKVERTSQIVLSRNRFHNPIANAGEVRALSEYQKTLVMPPNPYVEGDMPSELALPDGESGNPRNGSLLFAARCADCHTPPMFTTDQDEQTRGRFHDVGTPVTMSLRNQMQESDPYPLPVPSLVGAWDNFPLLHSGAAGFSVRDEMVVADERFPLRTVFDMARDSGQHGRVDDLDEGQVNDLLAFVLTL